jgi:hypothetical protein
MNIESIILLGMSILATLKAYFEWRKAKAESMRADNTEDILKHTIESVENAKNKMDNKTKMVFSEDMRKYIEDAPCDTGAVQRVVKEVTNGDGNIKKHTMKYSKDKFKKLLE